MSGPSAGARVDSARYTEPAWFQVERDRVFTRAWVPAAGAWSLRETGDFVVFEELGRNLLLLRGPEGVRAFENHCRHRGSPLLQGRGRTQGIVCPYHGWSYGLDGGLRGVPLPDGIEAPAQGLRPVETASWGGLHWVNLGSDRSLPEYLGPDLEQELAPYRYEEMVPVQEAWWTLGVNWKAFLENVTDFYHVPFVHSRSIAGMVSDGSSKAKAKA